MLAQILAIAVALGSGLLFLTAFIFPKLHRQDDFFWSTVGLFYALVLWVCAGQMAGAILLGQLASVILLGWFAWETLRLRQVIADPSKIPNLDKVSLVGYVKDRFKKPKVTSAPATKKTQKSSSDSSKTTDLAKEAPETSTPSESPETAPVTSPETEKPTPEPATPSASKDLDKADSTKPVPSPEEASETPTEVSDTPETESDAITAPPITAQPSKKGFSFGRLFGRKSASTAAPTETSASAGDEDIEQIFAEEKDASEPDTAVNDVTDETSPLEEPQAEAAEAATQAETEASAELDETSKAEDTPKD
ncbi:Ycf66 family protein [Picosynechococcus sp. NKBG042902]|uniref:Ycf66 family protein n=1 Tax=Picosynechococcus sp. NKBG042902 TaxID=490193 RepID=UPI0004AB95B5|nr:Ycf66 family protein [Picosynechococcus sp. NKBG042902]